LGPSIGIGRCQTRVGTIPFLFQDPGRWWSRRIGSLLPPRRALRRARFGLADSGSAARGTRAIRAVARLENRAGLPVDLGRSSGTWVKVTLVADAARSSRGPSARSAPRSGTRNRLRKSRRPL